jgi:DNA-directed RNA polymerase subunit M
MFCPKCGSVMMPKKEITGIFLVCAGCGNKMAAGAADLKLTEKTNQKTSLAVVEKEHEVYPVVEESCPKCKHPRAYFWTVQTRSADEPPTRFYKCEKCLHIWRKYK